MPLLAPPDRGAFAFFLMSFIPGSHGSSPSKKTNQEEDSRSDARDCLEGSVVACAGIVVESIHAGQDSRE